jgi:hypothetical protein
MATTQSIIQRAFASGELAPTLHSRADVAKYTLGLRTCHNFYVRKEGGVSNRAGFRFVEACKTNNAGTRLMPYIGSTTGESYLIEMGNLYFRFFNDGARPSPATRPTTARTSYVPGDLVASAGVNYYCHTVTRSATPRPTPGSGIR